LVIGIDTDQIKFWKRGKDCPSFFFAIYSMQIAKPKEIIMHFELTEEHRAVQEAARDFAKNELLPGVIERDIECRFPVEEIKKWENSASWE
jgi:hypothetical protein